MVLPRRTPAQWKLENRERVNERARERRAEKKRSQSLPPVLIEEEELYMNNIIKKQISYC